MVPREFFSCILWQHISNSYCTIYWITSKIACGEVDVIKGYLLKCSFKAFSYSGGDHGLREYNVLETIYNMKINLNP
jgi:hypothetical protein